jgi:hypothetical protein
MKKAVQEFDFDKAAEYYYLILDIKNKKHLRITSQVIH